MALVMMTEEVSAPYGWLVGSEGVRRSFVGVGAECRM